MSNKFPIIIIWFAAFVSGLFLINAWQLELFAGAVVLLLVWACVVWTRVLEEPLMMPRSIVPLLVFVLWLWMFASVLWAAVPFVSLISFGVASILPITFLTLTAGGRDADFAFLKRAMPVVFAGLAIWALAQFYAFSEALGGQVRYPLANPNSLAALFNLALFPALGVMVSTDNKKRANAALIFALLMFGGITATASRGALISGVLAFVLFLAFNPQIVKAHARCLGAFVVGAIILFALTGLGALEHGQIVSRMGKLVSGAGGLNDLSSNRLDVWAGAWGVIKENWLIGGGIGSFFLMYPAFRQVGDLNSVFMAHSDPLQYWAELGIAGPVLFYAICIAIVVRTFKAIAACDKNDPRRIRILAVTAAFFAVIFHTHFTFNLYVVPILFTMGAMMAWWVRETADVMRDDTVRIQSVELVPVRYRGGLVVIPLLLFGFFFVSFMASEHIMKTAKAEVAQHDMEGFTRSINMANEVALKQNYRPYMMAVTVPISILQANKDTMPDADRKEIFGQAWSYLNIAERLNPRNPAVPYYRGYLYKSVPHNLFPEEAKSEEEYYLDALALDPKHVMARVELLRIYRLKNDMERFDKVLEDGLKWRYRSANALQLYGEAELYFILTKQPQRHAEMVQKKKQLQARMKNAAAKAQQSMTERLFSD